MDIKGLNKTFGCEVEVVDKEDKKLTPVNDNNVTPNPENNNKYVDKQIKDIVNSVDEATNDILELARVSESPRAFEVYGTLLKTKLDALSKLADIDKEKAKLNKNTPDTQVNVQINQNEAFNINDIIHGENDE